MRCLFNGAGTGCVPAPPYVFLHYRLPPVVLKIEPVRGAVDSGLAAVLAAVESVAVFVRVCVFGFGWMVVRFVNMILNIGQDTRAGKDQGRTQQTRTSRGATSIGGPSVEDVSRFTSV